LTKCLRQSRHHRRADARLIVVLRNTTRQVLHQDNQVTPLSFQRRYVWRWRLCGSHRPCAFLTLDERQTIHQQAFGPPRHSKSLSKSGQMSAVTSRKTMRSISAASVMWRPIAALNCRPRRRRISSSSLFGLSEAKAKALVFSAAIRPERSEGRTCGRTTRAARKKRPVTVK